MICAVIGSPIAHSLSPQLHQAAYEALGLDWRYERHELTADQVAAFVAGLGSDWRGLSVTMPCKEAIVRLGRPDAIVARLGVGNTVIFDGHPSDPQTTRIYNTDVTAVVSLLGDTVTPAMSTIEVYGNGATARSVVFALSCLGVKQVSVRARDQVKTARLAADAAGWGITVAAGDPPEVLISTVPSAVALDWLADRICPRVVFDVLYDPWPTPLASLAAAQGARVITGLDLLCTQALAQIELMTTQSVDPSLLHAVAADLTSSRGQLGE
ncbi:MAG: shikimate dehydrogenase [Propionibacteriaceae bacterium]|nr:shikimate dehydrogenase [Propionibacteriaceae bacterium]